MVVGLLSVELFLPESGSLKAKRQILKGIKDRTRRDFNVSIAEVGSNDLWQRALLGIAVVSNDQKHANRVLSKIMDKLAFVGTISVIDYNIEFL